MPLDKKYRCVHIMDIYDNTTKKCPIIDKFKQCCEICLLRSTCSYVCEDIQKNGVISKDCVRKNSLDDTDVCCENNYYGSVLKCPQYKETEYTICCNSCIIRPKCNTVCFDVSTNIQYKCKSVIKHKFKKDKE